LSVKPCPLVRVFVNEFVVPGPAVNPTDELKPLPKPKMPPVAVNVNVMPELKELLTLLVVP